MDKKGEIWELCQGQMALRTDWIVREEEEWDPSTSEELERTDVSALEGPDAIADWRNGGRRKGVSFGREDDGLSALDMLIV